MKIFDLYSYLKTIISEVGINDIKRCSGLINLEEVLGNIGSLKPPVLVVENSGDGYLDLSEGNFDNSYYHIYILAPAKTNNAEDINSVVKMCKDLMVKLFLRIKLDEEVFQDYGMGLESQRISYSKIGPLISNFWGFSIGFEFNEDFVSE